MVERRSLSQILAANSSFPTFHLRNAKKLSDFVDFINTRFYPILQSIMFPDNLNRNVAEGAGEGRRRGRGGGGGGAGDNH